MGSSPNKIGSVKHIFVEAHDPAIFHRNMSARSSDFNFNWEIIIYKQDNFINSNGNQEGSPKQDVDNGIEAPWQHDMGLKNLQVENGESKLQFQYSTR